MATSRIKELDVAKGIGMLFVILGHMVLLGNMRDWVMSFYMPMFVIISGITYKGHSCKSYVEKLLVPYFVLGFACIVFYDGLFRKADFLSDIIGLICGCNAPFYIVNAAAPLWYLSMFFILKCVYSLVEEVSLLLTSKRVFNISRPEFWQTGIILLLSIIGKSLVSHRQMYSYVWNVDIAFLFLPFMWFGNCISYFFGRGREKIFITGIKVVFWGILSFTLFKVNGGYDVFLVGYGGNVFLFYLTAIAGTLFIIGVSRILIRIKWMEKIFSTIGENSLILLPIHYPLANLFLEYKSIPVIQK